MGSSVTKVYEDYIWRGMQKELAETLYGSIPKTLGETIHYMPSVKQAYERADWFNEERNAALRSILKSINKELGCLTPSVESSIDKMSKGCIEAAHQSIVMGGPGYVLNKAATATRIAEIAAAQGFTIPAFYSIADYDEVQSELVHIRTPLFGTSGCLISLPVPEGYSFSPVSVLPLPEKSWYDEVEERIRNGYRPMFKDLEKTIRLLFEERLEQSLAITRWGFVNSQTLGEWASRILARLFNIEGNLGIPILLSSNPELRALLVRGMEMMLRRDIRCIFIQEHKRITQLILEHGFEPGIGLRDSSYVPFLYECPNPSCNRSRFELILEDYEATCTITGKCPSCGQRISIEINPDNPQLGEHAQNLSPRVDSRQMILDCVVPVLCHVGGPGETAYYAQIIPAARKMDIPFPIFVKYPRVYFNTPWNESLGNYLRGQGIDVLHGPELFRNLGKLSKFRRKETYDDMNGASAKLKQYIDDTYQRLVDEVESIEQERESVTGEEDERLQELKFALERYLSWAFGTFTKGKKAQEASWSWIEWAINASFPDIFDSYKRSYDAALKNGSTTFVNFMV